MKNDPQAITRDADEPRDEPSTGESPRLALAPGEIVDRFRIGRRLGEGGHGLVYEAEHVGLGYLVALKVLDHRALLDPSRRARFRREAVLGARLRHRNVVAIVDSGELSDRTPYLVMEHVDGVELAELLDRRTLDAAATVDVGVQLLAALAALSRCEILHRDIKPHNVMLARAVDGAVELKLLDFGISKLLGVDSRAPALTQEGFVLGTPQYMSPEQVRGCALDVRSDLYATGALLYECLAGVPPIDGETVEGVLPRILFEAPAPLAERARHCPSELAAVIERALAKKPEDRYADPTEMSAALRRVADRLGLPRGADAWTDVEVAEAARASDHASPPASVAAQREPAREPHETLQPPMRRVLSGRALWPALVVTALALAGWAWTDGLGSEPRLAPAMDPASARAPKPERVPTSVRIGEAPPARSVAEVVEASAPIAEASDLTVPPARRSRRRPSAAELEDRALAAIVRGHERSALALYRRATVADPERASAWRGLGLAAASTGDPEDARGALARYLRLRPLARDRRVIEERLASIGAPE